MKRNNKSLKIILSIVIAGIVAIGGIIALIVNNNKKSIVPENGDYVLTAEQKRLVSKINESAKTSYSSDKCSLVEFEGQPIDAENVVYFDNSFFYQGIESPYELYVIDKNGNSVEFFDYLIQNNLIENDYDTGAIYQIYGNHLSFYLIKDAVNITWGVCTIQNNEVIVNKLYHVVDAGGGIAKLGDDVFQIGICDNFFAVLLKNGSAYNYELFEYLADYSNYESYKFEVDIESKIGFDLISDQFIVIYSDHREVVNYAKNIGFYRENIDKVIVSNFSLSGCSIVEVSRKLTDKNDKAVLSGGKYYSFSYALACEGKNDLEIDLGDFSKLKVLDYGDDYFAVFMQKVDENNNVIESGKIVYFDYELNKIASYDVENENAKILFSFDETLLTKEGIFATKNNVDCLKIFDFETNNLIYVCMFASGNQIVFRNESGEYFIADTNLQMISNNVFDNYYRVGDDYAIFSIQGNCYLFDSKTSLFSEINFDSSENSTLLSNSAVFLAENGENCVLYKNGAILENDILSYEVTDNYLKITTSSGDKYFMFAKNKQSDVSLFSAKDLDCDDETESEQLEFVNYSGGTTVTFIDAESFPEEGNFFDYNDSIMYKNNADGTIDVKATHCIQNGYYSESDFIDYFEFHYENESAPGLTNYLPYKIFYRVNISSSTGNPTLVLFPSKNGHFDIASEICEQTGASDLVQVGSNTHKVNHRKEIDGDSASLNVANSFSYDYIEAPPASGGNVKYLYAYTSSNKESGITMHESSNNTYSPDNVCRAEVYGESIRVTLIFTFKEKSGGEFSFNSSNSANRFDSYKISDNGIYALEKEYYNSLYYQTVVVGLNSEELNYYNDVLEIPNYQPLNNYFYETYLKNLNIASGNLLPCIVRNKLEGDEYEFDTMYSACVSDKKYYDAGFTSLDIGTGIKTKIIGAKLVGLTTINQTIFNNVDHRALYDCLGRRTFRDDVLEFSVYNNSTIDDEQGINLSTSLKTNSDGTRNYFEYKNPSFLYYAGGLNRYRYVFCVYEPEIFYLEVDYNIYSQNEENNAHSELNYLKNYAGLSVGIVGQYDYQEYRNNWTYTEESGIWENLDESDEKYNKKDFTNNITRIVSGTTEVFDYEAEKKKETSSVLKEFVVEGGKYYYVVVDGIKYYIQYNEGNGKNFIGSDSNSMYLIAYRYPQDLIDESDVSWKNIYGYICQCDPSNADPSGFYYNSSKENYYYEKGVDKFYIRLEKFADSGEFYVYYHKKNQHTRTSIDNRTVSAPMINEKFSFYYVDDVMFYSKPEHLHYNFNGWKVYLGDYSTNIILNENNYGSGIDINYNTASSIYNQFLAGSGERYFSTWDSQETNWNVETFPIRLVAQWSPKQCEVKAVMWTIDNDSYNGIKLDNDLYSNFTISTSKPNFIREGISLGVAEDGILTISSLLGFTYDPNMTFADLGNVLNTANYRGSDIQASDLACQFMGWVFQETKNGFDYHKLSPNAEDTDRRSSQVGIKNYIGATTTVVVYAYYSATKYEFNMILNPLGGAFKTSGNSGKFVFTDIYHSDICPLDYNVTISQTGSENIKEIYDTNRNLATSIDSNIIGYSEDLKYYSFRNSTYYTDSNIQIKISLPGDGNKSYYFKTIVFDNVILKYKKTSTSTLLFDNFKITFSYDIVNGNWTAQAVGPHAGEIRVHYGEGGKIGFGNFSSGVSDLDYNDSHNAFYIESNDGDITFKILSLSNPGAFNYSQQTFTGSSGFNISVYADTMQIADEKIVTNASKENTESAFNQSIVSSYSSQVLTNSQGRNVEVGKAAYFWVNGERYVMCQNWGNDSLDIGYYYITKDVVAQYRPTATRSDFLNYSGNNFYIYYDGSDRIFYPNKKVNTVKVFQSDSTSLKHNIYVKGEGGKRYYISYLSETTLDSLESGYYLLDDSPITGQIISGKQSDYFTSLYSSGCAMFCGYYDSEFKTLTFVTNNANYGYNNTRIVMFEPEQDKVYYSSNPSSVILQNQYELKNYISKMVIGNTTFSFDKISKNYNENVSTHIFESGYLNLNVVVGDISSSDDFSRRDDLISKTFVYLDESYIINDAYKFSVGGDFVLSYCSEDGVLGNKKGEYYLLLARNNEGFTRYFLVYSDYTKDRSNVNNTPEIKVEFIKLIYDNDVTVQESFEGDYSKNDLMFIQYVDNNNVDSGLDYKGENVGESDDIGVFLVKDTFSPTNNRIYSLKANNGSIITYVSVEIYGDDGNPIKIFEYELDIWEENGFGLDSLYCYNSGAYSYVSDVGVGAFNSSICYLNKKTSVYNNAIFNGNSNKFGCYCSPYESTSWIDSNVENTFNFDHLYLMIGGLYTNYSISVYATKYVEFIFENGDTGNVNPLLIDGLEVTSDSGKNYATLHFSQLKLSLYTKNEDGFVEINDENALNYGCKIKYYITSPTVSSIKPGTIRISFFECQDYSGLEDILKYGLYILASGTDYSVYFTNARFYGETTSNVTTNYNAFYNLKDYAGRTNNSLAVDPASRAKTDKMVYMETGMLFDVDGSLNNNNFFFFANNKIGLSNNLHKFDGFKDSREFNNKFMFITTAVTNETKVNTYSYLYNENLNNADETTSFISTVKDDDIYLIVDNYSGISSELGFSTYRYNVLDDGRLFVSNDRNTKEVYQFDDLNKTDSWFNDTILTNIDFWSNFGENSSGIVGESGNTYNWQQIDDLTHKSKIYETTMAGYGAKWTYYEIPGYTLKYILVKIANLNGYFPLRLPDYFQNNNSASFTLTLKGIGYNYSFLFTYDPDNACITLQPYIVDDTTNLTDKLQSINFVANDVQVSFLSMARSFIISYQNYDSYSINKISTSGSISAYLGNHTIYYDSITKLDSVTPVLNGYTFIGWGSYSYYDSGSNLNVSRYNESTNSWSTQSTWFGVSSYFDYTKRADLLDLNLKYTTQGPMPGRAFYVDKGYFVTDTGIKNTENPRQENYNFWCNYTTTFCSNIGNYHSGYNNNDNVIQLYALYKPNVYTIKFDVNNRSGGDVYADFEGNGTYSTQFLLNNLGFVSDGITYYAYVEFDSNDWYITSRDDFSFKDESVKDLAKSLSNEAQLVVDRFGYSWLGWYYKNNTDIKQGNTINIDYLIFNSYYTKKKVGASSSITLPTFNKTMFDGAGFIHDISNSSAISFVYYGQHKVDSTLSLTDGYVYFYDYRGKGQTGTVFETQEFNIVGDYLNSTEIIENNSSRLILSYYDTMLAYETYSVVQAEGGGYKIKIDRSNADYIRYITIYACWSKNRYGVVVDKMDNDTSSNSINHLGSTTADGFVSINDKYYFDDGNSLQSKLLSIKPTRIGYDFIGWAFNYIPESSSLYGTLAGSVNIPSAELNLCSDLLARYDIMNGISGTSNLESNILILGNQRIVNYNSERSSWILNKAGCAEHLGDGEVDTGEDNRYVYVFALWKAQTFSATVSLNINEEELKNLYEKDSSFAVGFYNNLTYTNFDGVNSNNYIYDKNASATLKNNSYYNYYYNDYIANIGFEIQFDDSLDNARCLFGEKSYKFADLFATSAGYYFLGLLYQNSSENYLVRNTLKSVLKVDEGLVNENDAVGASSVLKLDSSTGEYQVFNHDFYQQVYRSDYDKTFVSKLDAGSFDNDYQALNGIDYQNYGGKRLSSNFGIIRLTNQSSANEYFSIMSEVVDGEYYLYFLLNNVKYYVVYYIFNSNTNPNYENKISFDKTFLYYNEKDSLGNVIAKYIIRFNSDGEAYYVKNGFKTDAVALNLKVVVYNEQRNSLLIESVGGQSTIDSGSLFGTTNETCKITGYSSYKLNNICTREFTLFAHWEEKDIDVSVVNGNNQKRLVNEVETYTADSNQGLAGHHIISSNSDGTSKFAETSSDSVKTIKTTKDFYSTLWFNLIPYYNGRYMSEMTIEFDYLTETKQGFYSKYEMTHFTFGIDFNWDNSTKKLSVANIRINGDVVMGSFDYYVANQISYYNFKNVPQLSFIDKKGLNSASNKSNFMVYDYGSAFSRVDINRICFCLENIMEDVVVTCKYSIQTFDLEVYNVVTDNGGAPVGQGTIHKTLFTSLDDMEMASNKNPLNVTAYGSPFVSSSAFNNNSIEVAIISDRCSNLITTAYNVPYGYFIDNDDNNNYGNQSIDGEILKLNGSNDYYGFDFIYNKNYYKQGSLSSRTISGQYSNTLNTISSYIEGKGYDPKGFYTYNGMSEGYVTLKQYEIKSMIKQNTVIYGFFVSQLTPTKVLFYYWDNDLGRYVQYTNNIDQYTYSRPNSEGSNNNVADCQIEEVETKIGDETFYKYYLKTLPTPTVAPWYSGKDNENYDFLGYAYFDDSIWNEIVNSQINLLYNNEEYQKATRVIRTSGDAVSALSLMYDTNDPQYINFVDLIGSLTITDLFKNYISVYNYKYFSVEQHMNDDINSPVIDILDGIRVQLNISLPGLNKPLYVFKDLNMLNCYTEISQSKTVHAIPIYAKKELKILACSVDSENKVVTLNDSNDMIVSSIFETNSKYTIYYPTSKVQFDVNTGSASTVQSLNSSSKYSGSFSSAARMSNGSATINVVKNSKVVAFFTKGLNPSTMMAFAVSSNCIAIKNTSTITLDSSCGVINRGYQAQNTGSPLSIVLTGDHAAYYELAKQNLEELYNDGNISEQNKNDRELVIFIALQLMQLGRISLVNASGGETYFGIGTDYIIHNTSEHPTGKYFYNFRTGNGNFNIESCIEYFNDGSTNHLYVTNLGFIRLVYSIFAYAKVPLDPASVFTLENSLFGQNGSYDDIQSVMLNETLTASGVLPGDVMNDTLTGNLGIYNFASGTSSSDYNFTERRNLAIIYLGEVVSKNDDGDVIKRIQYYIYLDTNSTATQGARVVTCENSYSNEKKRDVPITFKTDENNGGTVAYLDENGSMCSCTSSYYLYDYEGNKYIFDNSKQKIIRCDGVLDITHSDYFVLEDDYWYHYCNGIKMYTSAKNITKTYDYKYYFQFGENDFECYKYVKDNYVSDFDGLIVSYLEEDLDDEMEEPIKKIYKLSSSGVNYDVVDWNEDGLPTRIVYCLSANNVYYYYDYVGEENGRHCYNRYNVDSECVSDWISYPENSEYGYYYDYIKEVMTENYIEYNYIKYKSTAENGRISLDILSDSGKTSVTVLKPCVTNSYYYKMVLKENDGKYSLEQSKEVVYSDDETDNKYWLVDAHETYVYIFNRYTTFLGNGLSI